MKTKYRIVPDDYAGYEIQVKYWFFPFWIQFKGTNTFLTPDRAEESLKAYLNSFRFKKEIVKEKNMINNGYKPKNKEEIGKIIPPKGKSAQSKNQDDDILTIAYMCGFEDGKKSVLEDKARHGGDCDSCEYDGDCYITMLKCKGYKNINEV